MYKSLLIVFTVWIFAGPAAFAERITAGTFNLRYDNPGDSGNLWKARAPVAASLVRFHQFDVIGTQEGLRNQINDLQQLLPEYGHYGVGRDDGKAAGEHSAIFYRKDRFTVQDSGDFWLSEHPEKPGFGWDAQHNRICSWLKLTDKKTKKVLYVFSVHFDHRGVVARRESGKLMVEKIKAIAGSTPAILVGDFNGSPESEWYKTINNSSLLKDAYTFAPKPYVNNGSFNAFQQNNPSNEIIDHIFITSPFKVSRYGILTDTYHGRFPSDHFPVLVDVEW